MIEPAFQALIYLYLRRAYCLPSSGGLCLQDGSHPEGSLQLGKSNTEQSLSLSVSKEKTGLVRGTEPSLSQQESFLSGCDNKVEGNKEIAR